MTSASADEGLRFAVLAVSQGQWGERIADHIRRSCPDSWMVRHWSAPRVLPAVIDDPADYLPAQLPQAELVLALGETPGVAQLVPDIVKMSGAHSVIAPIDRNETLPPGLVKQLRAWLADLGVAVVFPKPFCSLTETTYNRPPILETYDDPIIRRFARRFGWPQFRLTVDAQGRIDAATIARDSACGCGLAVARGLIGCPVDQAEYEAGMLHHHFPCLAGMSQDADYKDTLMHVSGHILREAVQAQIQNHLAPKPYFRPMGRVDSEAQAG